MTPVIHCLARAELSWRRRFARVNASYGSYEMQCKIAALVVVEAQSDSVRDSLRTYVGAKAGLTL